MTKQWQQGDWEAVLPSEYRLQPQELLRLSQMLILDHKTRERIPNPAPYTYQSINGKKVLLWGVVYNTIQDAIQEIAMLYTYRTN